MCVLFIVNRYRVRVVTRYPPSCFIFFHTGQLIVFNLPRINNMPEIKLKHVVSCSTEDSVSCLVTCFYLVLKLMFPFMSWVLYAFGKMWTFLPLTSCRHAKQAHKADNLLSSDTYRKWKAARPGEKQTSVILQVCFDPLTPSSVD